MGVFACVYASSFESIAIFNSLLVHWAAKISINNLFLPRLLEFCVGTEESIVWQRWRAEIKSRFLDISEHSRLGAQSSLVRYGDMSDNAYLACKQAALSNLGRTGHSGLGRDCRILTDYNIVCNLAQVIDSDTIFNYCGLHGSLVDCSIGTDFDIISDNYIAKMLDLPPCSVRLESIAETIVTDDAACMKNHPVTDDHAGEYLDSRIDDAVAPYLCAGANGDVIINLGAVADYAFSADFDKISDIDLLAKLCTTGNTA